MGGSVIRGLGMTWSKSGGSPRSSQTNTPLLTEEQVDSELTEVHLMMMLDELPCQYKNILI